MHPQINHGQQRGVTLVELMVALALSTLVIFVCYLILISYQKSHRQALQLTHSHQVLTHLSQWLEQNIHHAGYTPVGYFKKTGLYVESSELLEAGLIYNNNKYYFGNYDLGTQPLVIDFTLPTMQAYEDCNGADITAVAMATIDRIRTIIGIRRFSKASSGDRRDLFCKTWFLSNNQWTTLISSTAGAASASNQNNNRGAPAFNTERISNQIKALRFEKQNKQLIINALLQMPDPARLAASSSHPGNCNSISNNRSPFRSQLTSQECQALGLANNTMPALPNQSAWLLHQQIIFLPNEITDL